MPGSDAASGVSSLRDSVGSAANVDGILRPGQEDGQEEEKAFSYGVMGVMYTVCKEKGKPSIGFICFRLFVDWWQLWLLVVQPPHFDLPSHELWWRIFSFIGLNQFMSTRGYTFFLACFYLLVVGLVLSVALSVWVGVSFQQNRFDHVWPIVLLRWFAKVFYQMLDVMCLSLFLMTLDCQFFFKDNDVLGYNQEFLEIYCWTMPHLVHVFVAIIATVVFIVMDCFFVVGEIEMDFTSRNDLAIMHTGVELQTFTVRVLMTLVSVFVYNPKWASVSQMILSVYLTYLMCYWQPQVEGWVNHVRTGMYASVAWCSMLYVVLAFNLGWDASIPEVSKNAIWIITMIMWVSTIPAGMVGAWMSWLRLRHLNTVVLNKFRMHRYQETSLEDIHQFTDSRFVEVLARCCRVWVDRRTLKQETKELAEFVLKVGLAQLPKDPFMVILYSSFLMDVQSSYQSGYSQLQAAKKLDAGPLMRFAIFSREQQHAQRGAGGVGSRGGDLVSYVEFQRNYGMILKIHRETLNHITRFWETLMHRNVKFRTLTETVRAMDASIRQAERTYKQVLQRHATSVKMVRLYAKFLEDVKQDPWAASRWFSEAERLEAVEEEVKHHDALGGLEIDDPALRAALLEAGPMSGAAGDGRAIVIINAQSIIQMTNQAALDLLGYNKAEIKAKGLRMLLPACVADSHSTFVRNYIQTGHQTAMTATTQQLVVHKDKRLIPVKLTVTKISGIGEDTLIMAVLQPIPSPMYVATVWLMMDGTILTVCPTFEDWFGYQNKDVQAQEFQNLVVSGSKELQTALKKAHQAVAAAHQNVLMVKAAKPFKGESLLHLPTGLTDPPSPSRTRTSTGLGDEDDDQDREWRVSNIQIAHRWAKQADVDVTIHNAGVGVLRFQVLKISKNTRRPVRRTSSTGNVLASMQSGNLAMNPTASQNFMLVTNTKGQILHITSALAELLGRSRTPHAMLSLESLMVKPFGQLHRAALQGVLPTAPPPYSCRSGLAVLLQGQGPQGQELHQPYRLSIKKKVEQDDTCFVVMMQEMTLEAALDERRLLLELNEEAIVTSVTSAGPSGLFGFEPERLVGKHAGSFIDILRPQGAAPSGELDLVQQQDSLAVLLEMASPALDASSTCWRCGFLVPEAVPAGTESLAAAKVKGMLIGKAKPAVMRLRVRVTEAVDSQEMPGITLEMELWRADLVTSVIEIDNGGNIQLPEAEELAELYPPDLLLGTCLEDMVDQHISTLLTPLANKSLNELFVAGSFGQIQQVVDAKRPAKRSALKATSVADAPGGASGVGPVHLLNLTHRGDHSALQLGVQAVRKGGAAGGMYLVTHVVKPTSGRRDFSSWIMNAVAKDKVTRRDSVKRGGSFLRRSENGVSAGDGPANEGALLRHKASMRFANNLEAMMKRPSMQPIEPEQKHDPHPNVAQEAALLDEIHALEPDRESHQSLPMARSVYHGDAEDTAPSPGSGSGSDVGPSKPQDLVRIASWVQAHSIPASAMNRGISQSSSQNVPGEARAKPAGINWAADEAFAAPPEPEVDEAPGNDDAIDIADEAAAQAETVDESDYRRGQRFKKLYIILSGAAVQRPVEEYKRNAFALAAATVLIQLGAFITMYILLKQKDVMIMDLTYIGQAGIEATEVALYTRTLNMIYSNTTEPNLRLVSGPDDLPYLKTIFKKHLDAFAELHFGSYLGFEERRALPADGGLKALWEEPQLIVTEFADISANQSLNNFTVMKTLVWKRNASLWDAGNTFSQKAAFLLQNADAFNASLNGSVFDFQWNTNLQWLIENGPQAVFPGYLQTLDAYVEVILHSIQSVNRVQLILLALEGVAACAVISGWMYLLLKKVADQRYKIYHIFIIVPTSLVRRLATKQYLLGDEEEEEDVQEAVDADRARLANSRGGKPESAPQTKGPSAKVNIHIKTNVMPSAEEAPAGLVSRLWSKLCALLGIKKKKPVVETRRKLLPCMRQTIWLLWPFVLWGFLMIIGNIMGYLLLDQIAAPLAMFNMVNYVNLLYNRNNFFLQELAFEPFVAEMQKQRTQSYERIQDLAKEYALLLYGNQMTKNETAAHYTLVTSGIANTGTAGAEILFHTTECLCLNQSECHPPESHLYPDTRQGLNRMILKYLEIGKTIKEFQYLDPYLNGPEYDFYWNTRADIQGAFSQLTTAYQKFVVDNVGNVITLQIVMFVFSLLIVLGFVIFMLLPFLKVTKYETRRIAELLSQLPAEVDITSLVQQVLLPPDPEAGLGQGHGLPP